MTTRSLQRADSCLKDRLSICLLIIQIFQIITADLSPYIETEFSTVKSSVAY